MPLPEANLRHPSFPQPPDPLRSVWRYMDLERLAALLLDKELRLRRLDLLQDRFEGTLPKLTQESVRASLRALLAGAGEQRVEEGVRTFFNTFRLWRQAVYASCWRSGKYESGNVAHIRTSRRRLRNRASLCSASRFAARSISVYRQRAVR